MKLKAQILAFGVAGVTLASLVGGIGLFASSHLGDAIEAAVRASEALQASQEADMMHDAIRGDAQLALFGALQSDPARIDEAVSGLEDHKKTFNEALSTLDRLPIDQVSRDELADALPLVKSYIESGEQLVAAARVGAKAAEQLVPALQVSFSALEEQMAALSGSIHASSVRLNEKAEASVDQARMSIAVAVIAAAVIMLALAVWLAQRMTRPMAHAVDVADRLAEGDLTSTIQPAGNEEITQLLRSMARMQASLAGIVGKVKSNADGVATASAQIAQGNQDLSERTERQSQALQETAATMEELGGTVRNNADSAKQASQLAQGASTVAAKGGDVVGKVVTTMQGINESSRKIGDIIGVIDSIAFQTNILALNAAVEAARAGEQGRGFAVVASEVRGLAQRSAEAAKEIKALIGDSVGQVEQGTSLVDQAGKTMGEIVTAIQRVTDIVGEIALASVEQSAGVSQVGETVGQMDQATQQNAALVEQSAAAAESLKQQAHELVQAVATFRLSGSDVGAGSAQLTTSVVEPVVERRGPNRATNVTRPDFSAKTAPSAKGSTAEPCADTGTDNWTSF